MDVHRTRNDIDIYTVDLQVWRPSPTVKINHIYWHWLLQSVGNNRFVSIAPSGGVVVTFNSNLEMCLGSMLKKLQVYSTEWFT